MSEQKESSVLFSLKELMSLEEDRIRTEEADRAAQTRAQEEARRAAEQAAREAEEARIRAEEERRRSEEQRSREEGARLEAIRQAEVERARLEAEQAARMQAMAAQQQHERQLASIKTDDQKKKLRNLLIGVVVAVIAIGGVTGFVVYQNHVQTQQEIAAKEAEARKNKEQLEQLQKQLAEQDSKVKGLEGSLANAKDETEKAKIQAQLDAAKAAQEETKKNIGRAGAAGGVRAGGDPGGAAKPACNCKPTDPLCDCL